MIMVDPELDELRREFLAEAQGKVREMQSALAGGRSRESLERLAYIAHQLKGSGGSYGYERISAEAAELEQAVEKGAAAAIEEHVASLGAEIDRRAQELG